MTDLVRFNLTVDVPPKDAAAVEQLLRGTTATVRGDLSRIEFANGGAYGMRRLRRKTLLRGGRDQAGKPDPKVRA